MVFFLFRNLNLLIRNSMNKNFISSEIISIWFNLLNCKVNQLNYRWIDHSQYVTFKLFYKNAFERFVGSEIIADIVQYVHTQKKNQFPFAHKAKLPAMRAEQNHQKRTQLQWNTTKLKIETIVKGSYYEIKWTKRK